jgi:hypothetical protein
MLYSNRKEIYHLHFYNSRGIKTAVVKSESVNDHGDWNQDQDDQLALVDDAESGVVNAAICLLARREGRTDEQPV